MYSKVALLIAAPAFAQAFQGLRGSAGVDKGCGKGEPVGPEGQCMTAEEKELMKMYQTQEFKDRVARLEAEEEAEEAKMQSDGVKDFMKGNKNVDKELLKIDPFDKQVQEEMDDDMFFGEGSSWENSGADMKMPMNDGFFEMSADASELGLSARDAKQHGASAKYVKHGEQVVVDNYMEQDDASYREAAAGNGTNAAFVQNGEGMSVKKGHPMGCPGWLDIDDERTVTGGHVKGDDHKSYAECAAGEILTDCRCSHGGRDCDGAKIFEKKSNGRWEAQKCVAYGSWEGRNTNVWAIAKCSKKLWKAKTSAYRRKGQMKWGNGWSDWLYCDANHEMSACTCHSWWQNCGSIEKDFGRNRCRVHNDKRWWDWDWHWARTRIACTTEMQKTMYKVDSTSLKITAFGPASRGDDKQSKATCPKGSFVSNCIAHLPMFGKLTDGTKVTDSGRTCKAQGSNPGRELTIHAIAECTDINEYSKGYTLKTGKKYGNGWTDVAKCAAGDKLLTCTARHNWYGARKVKTVSGNGCKAAFRASGSEHGKAYATCATPAKTALPAPKRATADNTKTEKNEKVVEATLPDGSKPWGYDTEVTDDAGCTGDDCVSSVKCPSGTVMTACGIKGQSATGPHFDGSYMNDELCVARGSWASKDTKVQAVAKCASAGEYAKSYTVHSEKGAGYDMVAPGCADGDELLSCSCHGYWYQCDQAKSGGFKPEGGVCKASVVVRQWDVAHFYDPEVHWSKVYAICGKKLERYDVAACPAGSTSKGGDFVWKGPTTCTPTVCKENEHVVDNACVAVPPGTTRPGGDLATGANTEPVPTICNQVNTHVQDNTCVRCPAGTTNAAGDDASGLNTSCAPTICEKDHYVKDHQCVKVPQGYERASGDDASKDDTSPDEIICGEGHKVDAKRCEKCPKGKINEGGDGAASGDTKCDEVHCEKNMYVKDNVCTEVPPGTTRKAGDPQSGVDTTPEPIICKKDEYVKNNACEPVSTYEGGVGYVNAAGDDASMADTKPDVVVCEENEFVDPMTKKCTNCEPGAINDKGDEPRNGSTECDHIICEEGFYVADHECRAVPPGTTRPAGDDATLENTEPIPTICEADEYVTEHVCVKVANAGWTNEAGDDASKIDSKPDKVICKENQITNNFECVDVPPGSTRPAGDFAGAVNSDCSGEPACEGAPVNTDPIPTICDCNQVVTSHECVDVKPGTFRHYSDCKTVPSRTGPDSAMGEDTSATPIICKENEYVSDHSCTQCPKGMTREFGDDASGSDTKCEAVICDENHHVQGHECVKVDPGYVRDAGDNAAKADTNQVPVYCGEDEYVAGNTCFQCPHGTYRPLGDNCPEDWQAQGADPAKCGPEGGDPAFGADTFIFPSKCTPKVCSKAEHVEDGKCVLCPDAGRSAIKMKTNGGDTQCVGTAKFKNAEDRCPTQDRFNVNMCNSYMCNECYTETCTKHCQEIQEMFPTCRCAHWPESRKSFSGGEYAGKGGLGDKGDYSQTQAAIKQQSVFFHAKGRTQIPLDRDLRDDVYIAPEDQDLKKNLDIAEYARDMEI